MSEEEMKRMVEEMRKMPGMPAPMHITVQYDETLQKITGKAEDPLWMGEGGTFLFALQSIFTEHPDIEKMYPPGALGFLLSGSPPKPHSPLFDGDVISVSVPGNSRVA